MPNLILRRIVTIVAASSVAIVVGSAAADPYPPGCFMGETSRVYAGELTVYVAPSYRKGVAVADHREITEAVRFRMPDDCDDSFVRLEPDGRTYGVNMAAEIETGRCAPQAVRDALTPPMRGFFRVYLDASSPKWSPHIPIVASGPGFGLEPGVATFWAAGATDANGLSPLAYWSTGSEGALPYELRPLPEDDFDHWVYREDDRVVGYMRCGKVDRFPNPLCSYATPYGAASMQTRFRRPDLPRWREIHPKAVRLIDCALPGPFPELADDIQAYFDSTDGFLPDIDRIETGPRRPLP